MLFSLPHKYCPICPIIILFTLFIIIKLNFNQKKDFEEFLLPHFNNLISTNTISNQDIISPKTKGPINYYKYSELLQNPAINQKIDDNPLNTYRRQLIIAKLIISELQESNSNILSEKQQIENQLNEALNSIKSLHNDYISLTEKFSLVNQNININNNEQNNNSKENNNNEIIINDLEKKIKEIEEEKNELEAKNEELERKINNSNELNKMQEEKYNYKILLLTKKLEKTEYLKNLLQIYLNHDISHTE